MGQKISRSEIFEKISRSEIFTGPSSTSLRIVISALASAKRERPKRWNHGPEAGRAKDRRCYRS